MKKLYYILIALMTVACIASCKKEEPVANSKKLSVVSSDLSFSNAGGTGTIVVEAEETVTAYSEKAWAQVSVSGNTITVTCEPWDQLATRNSKITIISGDETLSITAIQQGVVFSMDGMSMTDVCVLYSGNETYTLSFSANAEVVAESETEWLTVGYDNESQTIELTPEENTEMATRHGIFTLKVGGVEKTYSVVQFPQFKETTDWSLDLAERGEEATKLKATVKVSHGYYYPDYATPGQVSKYASVGDFVQDVMVPKMRAELDEYIEDYGGKYGYTSFMSNKTETWTFDLIPDGDYVGFMVGFDKDGYPTGWYSATEMFIGEITPYMKWIGTWKLSGKNIEGNAYEETFEIMADPADVDASGKAKETSFIIHGLCSKNQEAAGVSPSTNYGDMYLSYDGETDSVTFTGQNGVNKFTSSTLGENCYLQLISMYVKAGATSYTNVTGGSFMRLSMNDDGTAKITILDRSAGLPYRAFRMRLLNASGSSYTIGGNAATIALDDNLTITKQ